MENERLCAFKELWRAFRWFHCLCCRFGACDRTSHILQNRPIHAPVLLLLLGHSCVSAGHIGCRNAHMEHFTSARRLPRTSSHNHQPLTGISFPSTSGQWLCGVAVLTPNETMLHSAAASQKTLTHLTQSGLTNLYHNSSTVIKDGLYCCSVTK